MLRVLNYIILFVIVCLASCQTLDVYEKTAFFKKHDWSSAEKPSFTFEIKDTTVPYNIFFVIRHHDAYHFKNIWVNLDVKDPDTTYTIKREFTLANNTQWLGTGMDDIIEQRMPFSDKPYPLKKGTYTFTLQQVMREDPLQNVMAAGIRVEKQKP